ncbi:S49 family peptidase [Chachezhania antarctica]|uniref:S49 family peptidase n=1 Tax=Chachezhania antarctica TaxID=2340860 RepID=UPI000EAE0815|nr:S49 family peptidase [Chachezhania antarctica]|tara:strand:+ start:3412 stop:4209 length:798 start_codon:yes stop_codon:yes gene_type:complete
MGIRIPFIDRSPVVSVVRLAGTIGSSGRGAINDRSIAPLLEKAFKRGKPKAVVLEINSPGGSAVQSSLIAARVRALSAEHNVPVLAFVEDVAASGGYWLATAADEIYADENSMLGSIGVIAASFGAHIFLARQGVERRVHTAGQSKSFLDPFVPEDEKDVARLKDLLDTIHDNFKAHVSDRRGSKLSSEQDLFTGEVWLARRAVELGLIDGIGHLRSTVRERFGKDVKIRRFEMRRPFWTRFGTSLAQDAIAGIEERAAYARFGL